MIIVWRSRISRLFDRFLHMELFDGHIDKIDRLCIYILRIAFLSLSLETLVHIPDFTVNMLTYNVF
jgi:hypothetical protein